MGDAPLISLVILLIAAAFVVVVSVVANRYQKRHPSTKAKTKSDN